MEILSSPFLAPLTFYPAPTTLFCLPRAVHVYAITPIPTACIASQPSLQPLHVLVICPNAARVFLKLRPSHITPFDIFNSNVFKKQKKPHFVFCFLLIFAQIYLTSKWHIRYYFQKERIVSHLHLLEEKTEPPWNEQCTYILGAGKEQNWLSPPRPSR